MRLHPAQMLSVPSPFGRALVTLAIFVGIGPPVGSVAAGLLILPLVPKAAFTLANLLWGLGAGYVIGAGPAFLAGLIVGLARERRPPVKANPFLIGAVVAGCLAVVLIGGPSQQGWSGASPGVFLFAFAFAGASCVSATLVCAWLSKRVLARMGDETKLSREERRG